MALSQPEEFQPPQKIDTSVNLIIKGMETIKKFQNMENITNVNRTLDFTQLLSGYMEDELKSMN